MVASYRACDRPHNRGPFQRVTELFTRKQVKSTQVKTSDSTSEKESIGVGAALRNEKIENARSIASAARHQRQQDIATSSNMYNALLERLEAKLLANDMECTELRMLVELLRQGCPISLSVLNLDILPEKSSSVVDIQLLERVEALLLAREKEGTNVRRLLVQARKRDEPPAQKGSTNRMSLAAYLDAPNSAPRRQTSSRSKKSTSSSQKGTTNRMSLAAYLDAPNSALRRQTSSRSKKSTSSSQKGTTNRMSLAAYLDAPNSALRRQTSSHSKKPTSSFRSKK
jgi:hypothetical protein